MLTILDRQMIFNYFKAYLFCLVSLMGLFIVVDLFMNLEDFTSHGRDFETIITFVGTYYGYKSFQIFDRLCESVILLAGMFTVAWMQRNNELLPLLSAGVSTRRAVRPVLMCAMGMMGLVVVNQEFALPNINAFMLENRQNPHGVTDSECKSCWAGEIHISGQSAVKKENLVKEFVAVLPASLTQSSMATLHAKEAVYIPEQEGDKRSGGWLLKRTRADGELKWAHESHEILKPLGGGTYFLKTKGADIETITRVKNWFMYLPTLRLLEELDRTNPQHVSLAVAFHGRLTRPLMGMILVLLGLSVILRDQNRNIFISAGLCLMLCVLFFASIFACQYLGKDPTASQYISPALSAWLPVIVFGPLSFVMFDAVHT